MKHDRILTILEEKTSINSQTGCWEWMGTITKEGYGRVTIDQKQHYVHRLSAMVFHGYRPEFKSLIVLHKCGTKNCWHRDHVYVGTQTDNMQDKSRDITHCPQGHEYTPENTYIYAQKKGGSGRGCKICRVERTREWRERKKLKIVGE